MDVLFVTPECFPFIKTGGLADVAGSLPPALRRLGVEARVLLPAYPGVLDRLHGARVVRGLGALPGLPPGASARLLLGRGEDDVAVYALDAPAWFGRDGNPYLGPDGNDWPDNHLRFAFFARVAALLGMQGDGDGWRPAVLHLHDWQAALVPAYLRYAPWPWRGERRPATVLTIHNLAFQGLFPATVLAELDLPPESFTLDGLEYYGQVGFLKAGLAWADALTTVSPTYAREIQGPDLGFGLDGLLSRRTHDLAGILNGVDTALWNPATDPLIAHRYDAVTLDAKAGNKAELQRVFGLDPRPDVPLFAVVSRLTHQKGIDLIAQALPRLLSLGGQLVVLGSGTKALEQRLEDAARQHPGMVGLRIGYDEGLSHRIQAGADVLMVPSRFEPCGLTQMYALRYGTLPLVSQVGGLADTVRDVTEDTLADGSGTGFVFHPFALHSLLRAVERAVALYRRPVLWRQVQQAAMARDVSWERPAQSYAQLYENIRMDSPYIPG